MGFRDLGLEFRALGLLGVSGILGRRAKGVGLKVQVFCACLALKLPHGRFALRKTTVGIPSLSPD